MKKLKNAYLDVGAEPQHTPTPDAYGGLEGLDMVSLEIILRRTFHDKAVKDIVQAVNAHEELVKLATDYYYFLKSLPRTEDTVITRMHVENIIAKAEGK